MTRLSNIPKIGYISVDALNNATVCNEALGLLEMGAPLEPVSVYRFNAPTFYQEESLKSFQNQLQYLYPLGWRKVVTDAMKAPFLFGRRFWSALWDAFTCPVEGVKQRLKVIGHLAPGLALALQWRGQNVQHIHAHWAHTATTIAMHAAKLLGVGFSFTGHANDLFVHHVALNAKLKRARFVVCISEFHRQFYLKRGACAQRLPVVYCGIDEKRFSELETVASTRPDSKPMIVAVGRLVEKKGFADLIRACASLRDRGLEFSCLIAGSGPLLQTLKQQVIECKLENYVQLTGETALQEDLPKLLSHARVFALPCVKDSDGDMDGLPQVLIEAMLLGLPVVSTRLVGIPDLVLHETNGLLVEPGDVAALADALEQLLTNAKEAQAFGQQGAIFAKSFFGRTRAVTQLSQLFGWAISHSPESNSTLPVELRFPSTQEQSPLSSPSDLERESQSERLRITQNLCL